jgi:hypothetical protein
MKQLLIAAVLSTAIFAASNAKAQDFRCPNSYSFSTDEECMAAEKDILSAIDYLFNTPINNNDRNQLATKEYLLQFMTDCHYFKLSLDAKILTFINGDSEYKGDLMIIFASGCTKYYLQTRDFSNKLEATINGLEMTIDYYKKNKKTFKNISEMEKLLQLQQKGKLQQFVIDRI